jgi:hypothetical protein
MDSKTLTFTAGAFLVGLGIIAAIMHNAPVPAGAPLAQLARIFRPAPPAPAPAAVPIAAAAGPAVTQAYNLIADWQRYLGERVTLRGRAYGADDKGAHFESGNVTFQLRRPDSETLRVLMRDCGGYGSDGCALTIEATPEQPGRGDAFKVLATPVIVR